MLWTIIVIRELLCYSPVTGLAIWKDPGFIVRLSACTDVGGVLRFSHGHIPPINGCAAGQRTMALFIPLDDFYKAITFLEPSRPGFQLAPPRNSVELNLSQRPVSKGKA